MRILFDKSRFVFLLTLYTLSLPVYAYDFQSDGIYYDILEGNNVAVTSGDTNYAGDVTIPKQVNSSGKAYNVTKIGDYAFYRCSGLTSITIPNSVTSIGNSAFKGCSGLILLTIPNSVTSIGRYAFRDCSGLTSITIPNSVTSIGEGAFGGCSGLTSITIPNSVTTIGYYAFTGCSGLISIKVLSGNVKYDSRNSCNAIIETSSNTIITGCKNTEIPNSVTSIGDYAFQNCSGLTSITIPNSMTSIGMGAFSYSGLTSITIPNSVTSIGGSAFEGCRGLTSITIPNSVTNIGDYAFYGCSRIKNVLSEIKNPFKISENVFSIYSTAKLTVPKGTKSAYQSTNYWNKFSNIVEATEDGSSTKRTIHVATAGTLPDLISESEKYSIEELTLTGELNGTDFRLLRDMAGCNYWGESTRGKLKMLDLSDAKIVAGGEKYLDTDQIDGNGVVAGGSFHYDIIKNDLIPDYVFYGCFLKEVHISNSVTSIGEHAFGYCSALTSITVSNSVTSIGENAFYGCSGLTSLTVPNSVTSIGGRAFMGCSGLSSITMSNSVISIGDRAFENCSGLKEVNISDIAAWCIIKFVSSNSNPLYYAHHLFMNGKEVKDLVIPNSVTSIYGYTFFNSDDLTSITIPNSVTSIGNYAFYGCSGLKDVISEIKTPFEIYEGVFSIYTTAKLSVPKGTKSAYQSTKYWNKFTNIVEAEPEQPVIVTANNYSREYGDDNPTFEYAISGGALGGTPKITCSATKTSPVGTYPIKIEKGSVTNTKVTYVDGTLTITKAPLTITAKSYTREEDEENPNFEVTYEGFKNDETSAVLTQMPTVSTTATKDSPAGTYDITISGAEAQNYSFTYVNGTLTVTEKDLVSFTQNGITYLGAKSTLKANFQSVDNNLMNIEIPSTVSYDGKTYEVSSFANDALSNRTFNYVSLPSTITSIEAGTFNNSTLGALIWNAEASLSSDVFNNMAMPTSSNFILYVNSKSYAPSNVSNVVVGGTASSITLADATNTRFYCPIAFTAQTISYTHNYSMKTGGSGMGWETLALPFDVQKIEHKTKGTLTPFAAYNGSSSQRPFWLYELGSNGFRRTDGIKANTPYIISMPNNSAYDDEYIMTGDVTFSATNATVVETGSIVTSTSNGKTFVPAFAVMDPSSSVYALNVVNKLISNSGSYDAGSRFINNMSVYPFEAYMTTTSSARYLAIEFDADATNIEIIPMKASADSTIEIFAIGGQRIAKVGHKEYQTVWQQLPSGVYIVNGRKVIK